MDCKISELKLKKIMKTLNRLFDKIQNYLYGGKSLNFKL